MYQRGFAKEGNKVLQALLDAAMEFDNSKMYPGLPEYFDNQGRGLYAYLTGAASWYMLTMITEVFGVKGDCGDLKIAPALMPEQYNQDGKAVLKMTFAGRNFEIIFYNKEKKEFFKFKNKIGYQKIDVQDIYYFESENKIVKIHCTNNIIKFYGKLNDVEQKLNDSFIRIHSSILVNSVYIAQFKYNEVKMINGELLPISQSRRQYIRKKQMDRWENNS